MAIIRTKGTAKPKPRKNAQIQTQPTKVSAASHLARIKDVDRRRDCETMVTLMSAVTKQPPVMWGPAIVGFGTFHYVYESGREGDMPLAAFANRVGSLTVYVLKDDARQDALLAKLGKHKKSGVCLHLRSLEGVDLKVLKAIVANAMRTS